MKTLISSTSHEWMKTTDVCSSGLKRKYIREIARMWPQGHLHAEKKDGLYLKWYLDLCDEEIGKFLTWAKCTFGCPLVYDINDGMVSIEIYNDYRE